MSIDFSRLSNRCHDFFIVGSPWKRTTTVNNRFNDGKEKEGHVNQQMSKKKEVEKLFVLFCFVRFVGTILSLWVSSSSFEIRWGGGGMKEFNQYTCGLLYKAARVCVCVGERKKNKNAYFLPEWKTRVKKSEGVVKKIKESIPAGWNWLMVDSSSSFFFLPFCLLSVL